MIIEFGQNNYYIDIIYSNTASVFTTIGQTYTNLLNFWKSLFRLKFLSPKKISYIQYYTDNELHIMKIFFSHIESEENIINYYF